MTRLERFGWRGEAVPGVARIVSAHGDYYHLVCNEADGEIIARKKKSAFSKRIETVKEKRGIKKVTVSEMKETSIPHASNRCSFLPKVNTSLSAKY